MYDKSALLHLKHSPLARTPPRTMPHIPGVTHAAPGAEVVTAAAAQRWNGPIIDVAWRAAPSGASPSSASVVPSSE